MLLVTSLVLGTFSWSGPVAAGSVPRLPTAQFDPVSTAELILTTPLLPEEQPLGGGGSAERMEPVSEETLGWITITDTIGAISFEFYASADQARRDPAISIGDETTLDGFPGVTGYIVWWDGSADGGSFLCAQQANVVICGLGTVLGASQLGDEISQVSLGAIALDYLISGLSYFQRITGTPLAAGPPGDAGPVTAGGKNPAAMVAARSSLPSGLIATDGRPYRIEADRPVGPDGTATTVNAGFSPSQVAWILAHPGFLDGVPLRAVTEGLAAGSSSVLAGFSDPRAIESQILGLGWVGGYRRIYALDAPNPGEVGYFDVVIGQFGAPGGAVAAATLLADDLASYRGMTPVTLGPFGEYTAALTGPAVNGTEVRALVASGPYLVSVTGVAPQGTPSSGVAAVMEMVLGSLP